MDIRYSRGDRVMDYRTYQVYGNAHLGVVVETPTDDFERFGQRVSVVWDTDPSHTPDSVYAGDLALVTGAIVG